MTAEERSVPGDHIDNDIDDDVVEELRRCNPVDAETLPSSRSSEATRTLEQILELSDAPDSESDQSDESSLSPTAINHGGRAGPPPRPTSQ